MRAQIESQDWLVLGDRGHDSLLAVLGSPVTAEEVKTAGKDNICSLVRFPAWRAALEGLGQEYAGFGVLACKEARMQEAFSMEVEAGCSQ